MLLAFALKEKMVASSEEFENSWATKEGDAWEADSSMWGAETRSGAKSYVLTNITDQLDGSNKTDADKITYADATMEAQKAFEILRRTNSVKFGVAPNGAVQCGVTFASLYILDTVTGAMYHIIMEGSGC